MNLAGWLRRHRSALLLAMPAVVAGGLAALSLLPVSLFPVTSFPRIVVAVDAGDRSAEQMVLQVTQPLEEAVRSVPGVRRVRSTTSRGTCDISIDFAWGTEMVPAALLVDAEIGRQLGSLPSGLSYEVRRMDPTIFPVVGASLTSSTRSQIELRDIGLYELQPLLSSIEGVASVQVQGGRTEELQVLLDPVRLEAAELTLDEVVARVSAANAVAAVGRLEQDEKLYLVLANTPLADLDALGQIPLRHGDSGVVLLSDVAELRRAPARTWMRTVADGRDAVLLNALQQPGGDTLRIAREIEDQLTAYEQRSGGDLAIRVWYDQSDLVRASVTSLRDAVAIGLALAALVLLAFLASAREALISLVVVPLALAATLLGMWLTGLSLNLMTLGGMAAAVGLMIDDAIVVVEHAERRVREGCPSALDAAAEMRGPLTTSSLATVIVFLPLAFVMSVSGAFFRSLSITMAMALAASYAAALLVLPLLLERRIAPAANGSSGRGAWLPDLLDRYEELLLALLERPRWLLIGLVPFAALCALAYGQVGAGFLPGTDEGGFVLDYVAPPGTSLQETDRRLRELENELTEIPEVRTYSRRTGGSLGGFVTEVNEGDYFVRLRDERSRSIDEIMDDLRARIEAHVPGLQVELLQLMEDLIGDLTAVPQPIEVELFGHDPAELGRQADRVADVLRSVANVVDVKNGVVLAGDTIDVRVDRSAAALLGLDPDGVERLMRIVLQGEVVGKVLRDHKLVGVRVWSGLAADASLEQLTRLHVRTPDGRSIRLGRVARFSREVGEPRIERDDLQTVVAVTGRISGRDLGSVMADVRRELAGLALPEAVELRYGGLYREQQASFRAFAGVLVAAALLVFLLLAYAFDQLAAPAAILATVSLAAAAVFCGLWWTDTELNIASLMGLTMIVGISAETCVFYLSQWKELAPGLPPGQALVAAGRLRARPILMTVLAAIGALLPLALAIGKGAAMLQPLAIAIVSGLVVTLPGVLFVLPVVFHALGGDRSTPGAS